MPALKILGHRTPFAGDDLSWMSLVSLFFKLVQFSLVLPLVYLITNIDADHAFTNNDNAANCSNHTPFVRRGGLWMTIYFYLSCAQGILFTLLTLSVLYESRKGTPTQTEKRRFLKPLCYVELFPANLLRCVTFAFGCIAKFSVQQLCTCQTTTEAIVNVSDVVVAATSCQSYAVLTNLLDGVLLSQAIEICVAGGILTILFLKTARPGERATRIMSALLGKKRGSGENKGWTFVCRFCCTCTSIFTCCLFGGARAAFADLIEVSTALEVYFDSGGYLDVTLSDIISGLILVYREQKLEREACRRQLREWQGLRRTASDEENQSSGLERLGMNRFVMKRRDVSGRRRFVAKSRLILDSEHDHDREAIFDGAHYMRLALAVYGHQMYMLDHPSTGWINLAAKALSCFTYPFSERHAKGDNTCGCYRTAFLLAAELEEEDLIFMSFRNGIVRRPYCIVVDQEKRAIVVVIRGTLSLEDTLTDLAVRPVSICTYKEKYGFVFDEAYCHAGMWGSAEWIFDDLKRHGGLENILKEGSQYSDFELCVVGHSLGGGVASVLSMMLLATYPSLKCYAFSPPGCVMSKEIAKAKHITSYVFESDIVPRLSLHSLENLRADILEMIASAKAEKHRIITRKTLFARTLDEKMFRERNRELLHSEDSVPASKFQEDLDAFLEYAAAKKAQRSDRFDVILYPPGRIVQILTTKREFVDTDASGVVPVGRPETHDLLTAVWASNEDFAEIQISDAFISDHRPSNVYQGLQMIAQSFSVAIQKTREDTSCKATSLAVGNFPDQQA